MKKVYILKNTAMNGTVTAATIIDVFLSKELAEKCQKVLDEKNKNNNTIGWQIHSNIEECNLYETEEDCYNVLKNNK